MDKKKSHISIRLPVKRDEDTSGVAGTNRVENIDPVLVFFMRRSGSSWTDALRESGRFP